MLNDSKSTARAPMPARAASPGQEWMLMVEHHLVSRRTIATVIHELGMARVEEAVDLQAASRRLQATSYSALLIDLGRDPDVAIDMIARVRNRQTACPPRMPVIALCADAGAATLKRLNALETRMLLRPFKVRTLLEQLRDFQRCAALDLPALSTPF